MAELGVVLRSSEPKGVAEEAAFAYKDIESVMAASASLVGAILGDGVGTATAK